MFDKSTVFVLGAGASWHYGYPTGEQLVHLVRSKSLDLRVHFERSVDWLVGHMPYHVLEKHNGLAGLSSTNAQVEAWKIAAKDCEKIDSRLRDVDPLVIDYFLGHNKDLQPLGKLLITWVLRQREAHFFKTGQNANRARKEYSEGDHPRDNWIRFVLHRLTVGCKSSDWLLRNNVSFVTFNYDMSLEDQLQKGLRSNSLFEPEHVSEFLAGDRIMHIYGKIRESENGWGPLPELTMPNGEIHPVHGKSFFDDLYRLSRGIRTIDPDDKRDEAVLEKVKARIMDATCIYILGFGFDGRNCERIGLDLIRSREPYAPPKKILFTNFLDSNRVNKAASKTFCNDTNAFIGDKAIVDLRGAGGNYFEKSTKDCYGALAYDFDEVEQE